MAPAGVLYRPVIYGSAGQLGRPTPYGSSRLTGAAPFYVAPAGELGWPFPIWFKQVN